MRRAGLLLAAAILAVALDLVLTFLVAPDAALFRARLTARIFYYHVPSAWVAYLAFAVTAAAGAWHLARADPRADALAAASAEVGLLFGAIALGTGLAWSTQEFGGSYRALEDPAVLSLAVVLLSYAAYFALRAAIDERPRRARLAAAYGLVACLGVPLSYLAIKASVHPDFTRPEQTLDPTLGAILAYSTLAFTALYASLAALRYHQALADARLADLEES